MLPANDEPADLIRSRRVSSTRAGVLRNAVELFVRSPAWMMVVALAASTGCERDAPASSDARRAILGEAAAEQHFQSYGPASRARFAVPTEAEIAALEERLPAALRRAARDTALAERSTRYLRQYLGYVDAQGRRWTWGNFFCRDPMQSVPEHRDRWRTHYVIVDDGGDCYFSAEFSPAANEFRHLIVNGDA